LDIKDLEHSFPFHLTQGNKILTFENSQDCSHILEGYQNCFQTFWGTQGRGPGPYYTTHRGLVFIMSSLHTNLGRGTPRGSQAEISFQLQFLREIGNHNVLPPHEGEEITLRTRNQKTDLIIRSCLKIYTTQVLYNGLDIIVIMAFLS